MLRKIIEKLLHYFEAKLAVLKLSLIQQIALVMGFCMFLMLMMTGLIAVVIILGMGLSSYFAQLTDSEPAGYFITTGIYLLLLGLGVLFKKRLMRALAGLFVNVLTDDTDNDD